MLVIDPERRYTTEEIFQHHWMHEKVSTPSSPCLQSQTSASSDTGSASSDEENELIIEHMLQIPNSTRDEIITSVRVSFPVLGVTAVFCHCCCFCFFLVLLCRLSQASLSFVSICSIDRCDALTEICCALSVLGRLSVCGCCFFSLSFLFLYSFSSHRSHPEQIQVCSESQQVRCFPSERL